jgi:hypothetical protein
MFYREQLGPTPPKAGSACYKKKWFSSSDLLYYLILFLFFCEIQCLEASFQVSEYEAVILY